MIIIPHTQINSDHPLEYLLEVATKDEMQKICKAFDLYVSPNIKKAEMARRLAEDILENPLYVLSTLSKTELQLVDEFVKGGPNYYAVRKLRKTFYKLQKFYLILTYVDRLKGEWHMIMPDCVRESLSQVYKPFLNMAEKGIKRPTPKEIRFMGFAYDLREGNI